MPDPFYLCSFVRRRSSKISSAWQRGWKGHCWRNWKSISFSDFRLERLRLTGLVGGWIFGAQKLLTLALSLRLQEICVYGMLNENVGYEAVMKVEYE